MSKESISKIYLIIEKIDYIEEIVSNNNGISNALNDIVTLRPAILMHLTAIAEQFNKLKQSHADEILAEFDKDDLKGLYDVRTYIAHDYEGVNIAIIEWIIRYGLPNFKVQCKKVIDKFEKSLPNKETIDVINEARNNKNIKAISLDNLKNNDI